MGQCRRRRGIGAHDDRLDHITFFHRAIGSGFLDVHLHDVTNLAKTFALAEHADHGRALGARVIGYFTN